MTFQRRPWKLPEWRKLLYGVVAILFFGYWIFTLQGDFRDLHRLQQEHRRLTYLHDEESARALDTERRLAQLAKNEEWENLIRQELRYVKKGEIPIRIVPHAPVNHPTLWNALNK